MSTEQNSEGRRALLKALGAGVGYVAARAVLPLVWSAPVVASMSLPAHAAASGNTPGDGAGTATATLTCEKEAPPSGSTEDKTVVIAPTVSGDKITLDITLPATLTASPQPYLLCEIASGTTGIATMALPSSNTALSGKTQQTLSRGAGTYKFQVRWLNGHSAWVEVTK